jgi:hypothetical protein
MPGPMESSQWPEIFPVPAEPQGRSCLYSTQCLWMGRRCTNDHSILGQSSKEDRKGKGTERWTEAWEKRISGWERMEVSQGHSHVRPCPATWSTIRLDTLYRDTTQLCFHKSSGLFFLYNLNNIPFLLQWPQAKINISPAISALRLSCQKEPLCQIESEKPQLQPLSDKFINVFSFW